MAATMIPPATAPAFLAANGWAGAAIVPLAGDASFRRYFRVVDGARTAVLMDAPPEHEDSRPFLAIAAHLLDLGFRAPTALAADLDLGLILLDDFGDKRVAPLLAGDPSDEQRIYERAIDIQRALHAHPPPRGVPAYDRRELLREVGIFAEWYLPAVGCRADLAAYEAAWDEVWQDVLVETATGPVLTLRDYHADNLMVLEGGDLGLLDFQDALAGHPAYDLVSLLQDARRDVAPALEDAMLQRYGASEAFRASYEVLGAQRNTKILGVFTRLWKRDGKPGYRQFQPRAWGLLERNLRHPSLKPVADWFNANVPSGCRATAWLEAA